MRKSIYNIIKSGRKLKSNLFNLYFKERDDYKIGFIASSKIGKPVKRNYAKRVIREYWKKNFKKGDFIFVLKPGIIDRTKEEILKEIERMVEFIKCENF